LVGLKDSRIARPMLGLLFLLLVCSVQSGTVSAQNTAHATYETRVKANPNGNGSVSIVYSIFAGDQSLHVPTSSIFFPIHNSSTVIENSIGVSDMLGQNYAWFWDNSNRSLRVTIGPFDIAAGGKYEIRVIYDQRSLCTIINETHYFVYGWDFSAIQNTPYTITGYDLSFERPGDTLLDSYTVTYIGTSPANLVNYMTQNGPITTFAYTFSTPMVTLNVYYRHGYGLSAFAILTVAFALALTIALFVAIRRRRR